MDVLLVSCRALPASPSEPHWSRVAARHAAIGLCSHPLVERVRWICPLAPAERPPEELHQSVELLPILGEHGAFGDPQERLCDPAADRELTVQMRRKLPDVVHCFGMGSPGSSALPWVAERMGRAPLVSVRADEVLCHRLDLQPWDGAGPCATWDDPDRCVRCCGEAVGKPDVPAIAAGGSDPSQDRRGFTALGFQNRLELSVGGLVSAAQVLVAHELDQERLIASGLSKAKIAVAGDLLTFEPSRYL